MSRITNTICRVVLYTITVATFGGLHTGCGYLAELPVAFTHVSTIAGLGGEIGEPFGVLEGPKNIYVSDGLNGKILILAKDGKTIFERGGLDTPSGLAFADNGDVIVADTGRNVIYRLDPSPTIVAGIPDRKGFSDGASSTALFNGPVGLAAGADGKIFVADTYNDRIRVIEQGNVTTLAGGENGYSDGIGSGARFDTPTGLAIWQDKLLVADTGNRRIRVVEPDGRVWTLVGNGNGDLQDGLLSTASFVQPTAIAVDKSGSIFVADGNAIRRISSDLFPLVVTISDKWRGVRDGAVSAARFNRPSGLAVTSSGDLLVADSENRLVRRFSAKREGHAITSDEIASMREKPDDFRKAAPARWPYDPPTAKRDIAGTLGEIRGEMQPGSDEVWFHNGLDIAGAYGETARFVRDEKVLLPIAAENFGTLRELIRMPTMGYIHIRLGRDQTGRTFGDDRFQFLADITGKQTRVRVPRGTHFKAGDPIGTLNAMNHVHLIAGRSGSEMNAMAALELPGLTDTRPPVIEKVTLFDENWREIETPKENSPVKLTGKVRIVVRAYDQTDGNAERRRLGVYAAGYEILLDGKPTDRSPVAEIRFDGLPPNEAAKFVYANGSKSGATGETIFGYIATNRVNREAFSEGFLEPARFRSGSYLLRVFAADYFGNRSFKDIAVEF